jgi:hypothetical protein
MPLDCWAQMSSRCLWRLGAVTWSGSGFERTSSHQAAQPRACQRLSSERMTSQKMGSAACIERFAGCIFAQAAPAQTSADSAQRSDSVDGHSASSLNSSCSFLKYDFQNSLNLI